MRKRVALTGLLLVLLVGAVLALGWWRSLAVPDWFDAGGRSAGSATSGSAPGAAVVPEVEGEPGQEHGSDPGDRQATAAGRPGADLIDALRDRGRVEVDAARLRELVVESLGSAPDGRVFLRATRSVQARIADGRVAVGGLLDLAAVDEEALSPEARETVAVVRRYTRFLGGDERYVGFSGSPRAVDGGIGVNEDAVVLLGSVPLPLSTLASLAGPEVNPEAWVLQVEEVRVTRAEVAGDRVVLEGGPR